MPTASTTLSSKDDLNCSREIFHDNSSTDDAEDVEDISDEAIDMRHNETLRKMRDRWMQLQQLRKEQKLQSGGPNALKSASGSANKHSHSYGHKKKYKSSTPRSEFGLSKGSIPKSTYSSRKRGRGRPPKSNHSQYVHAVEKSEGIQSGNGSAKEDDDSSHGIDNDNENENENEHFGHEEETDSAIDKEDEEEETEELPDLKRLHTRSSNINSPTHSVNSRRVIH